MPLPHARRRRHGVLLAVVALTGLTSLVGGALQPTSAAAPVSPSASALDTVAPELRGVVPRLSWTPCLERFECATADVPLDYDQPHGQQAHLAMIRYPAADAEHRIGSLFLNPGGPGGSGVDFLATAPQVAFDLFPRFDIVSWDPRGIGASTPAVDCSTDAEDDASVGGMFATPATPVRDLVRGSREAIRGCLAHSQPGALAHLSTANTARDLDLMRAAVGDEELTYLGLSYGTYIGATYTSLFPGRVRAMIADAPIDPDVWANEQFRTQRERVGSFESSLRRFLDACDAGGTACGSWVGGSASRGLERLVSHMNAHPLPAPGAAVPGEVTGHELLGVAGESLYSKFLWPTLAAAIDAAAAGDGTAVRDLATSFAGRRPDGTWRASGVFLGTTAQDWRTSRRVQDYVEEGDRAYAAWPHFWWIAAGYDNVPYALWPFPSTDAFRGPFSHRADGAPVLVIGGTHDPATPYEWSRRYTRQLGNARLLTYESDGHGAVTDLDPCVIGATVDYLVDLTVPPAGATCTQDFDPFGSAARSTAPQERWDLPRMG